MAAGGVRPAEHPSRALPEHPARRCSAQAICLLPQGRDLRLPRPAGFTDALTELLETVIRQRSVLDRSEKDWEVAHKEVERERKRNRDARPEEPPEEWLATLGEAELRALLTRVPHAVLRKLKPGAPGGTGDESR